MSKAEEEEVHAVETTPTIPVRRAWREEGRVWLTEGSPGNGGHVGDGDPKPVRHRASSLVLIKVGVLRSEIARRGWTYRDLMKVAGIGNSTMTAITSGRRVSPRVLAKIARALDERPPMQGADRLMSDDDDATK